MPLDPSPYTDNMAKKKATASPAPGVASRKRERRVSRTYRLPLSKLEAAQRALGAPTATETIERALDLVLFQRALVRGTRAMLGITIIPPDAEWAGQCPST